MADQLATPEDLASLLQLEYASLTAGQQATLLLLVETATGVVQDAAGGQRIVAVAGDVVEVMGTHDSWLALPQIPVTAVASVTVDGDAITDWKLFGNRLFRRCGWQVCWDEPSLVSVTCDHGYADGAQELQNARRAVLAICQAAYGNPGGLSSESIDDYKATYSSLAAALDAAPELKASLRRTYGRRAGLVRVG